MVTESKKDTGLSISSVYAKLINTYTDADVLAGLAYSTKIKLYGSLSDNKKYTPEGPEASQEEIPILPHMEMLITLINEKLNYIKETLMYLL